MVRPYAPEVTAYDQQHLSELGIENLEGIFTSLYDEGPATLFWDIVNKVHEIELVKRWDSKSRFEVDLQPRDPGAFQLEARSNSIAFHFSPVLRFLDLWIMGHEKGLYEFHQATGFAYTNANTNANTNEDPACKLILQRRRRGGRCHIFLRWAYKHWFTLAR